MTGPPRSWAWRYRRVLFLISLLGFAAMAGGLMVLAQVPLPPAAEQAQTTFLTDVKGARLASIDGGEDRVPITLDEVPQVVIDAVLATEDRNFFTHGGIDPVGILRATAADLRGRPLQGGSTITQQYVKQTFLETRERTIWRKLREASLAVKLERRYDKPEILERYLNTVYFGRGAYGVQAASRAYFNADVGDLELGQAAYLAGLIRSPETADAYAAPEVATARRDRTLAAMRATGKIRRGQYDAAVAAPLQGAVVDRPNREPAIVGADRGSAYFVEYVRAELVRRYGEAVTYQQGLRVKTTLDPTLQAEAYDAVYGTLDRPGTDPAGALVSIDDEGRVVAMVGGRDFTSDKVNLAVGQEGGGSGRQAGSTFKPFVLAAIVKDGYTVSSTLPGPAKIVLPKADDGKDYPVENYEKTDYGDSVNLVDATVNSVNTTYVQAQLSLGAQKAVDLAKAAGIRTDLEPNASLVLGTEEVTVLDLASAYSTFANRGVHVAPRTILEVRRSDGTVLEAERSAASSRVLDREDADVVNHVLRQVVERGSGTSARFGHPVAGKTGTTQDFGDAWFVGYTPKLTTAVWMGFPEGNTRKMTSVRGIKVNGGSFPARIFRRYMTEVANDERFLGSFPTVKSFPGKKLAPPKRVILPSTTTSSTSSTSSTTSSTVKGATTTSP
ncbi:MAG: transglycosylase domain-containing protein, partial [Actinomycetota bacterium]|nr:transglycosylase domain-containing protein [Actinomycetota bacterium]